jgi:polyhydroxyalkanoate synthesis repressor PhaR
MNDIEPQKSEPVRIKKYANRRLYNTATSSYVTLENLCQMVKSGTDFVVHDAKTGEDITRSVLTQIIVEEEAKGSHLLPVSFLRQIISLYGDNMEWLVPRYLEYSMAGFARNQEQIRQYLEDTFGSLFPFSRIEEMSKQNMAIFESAMKMFSPFSFNPSGSSAGSEEAMQEAAPAAGNNGGSPPAGAEMPKATADVEGGHKEESLEDLKAELEAIQKRLHVLFGRDQ